MFRWSNEKQQPVIFFLVLPLLLVFLTFISNIVISISLFIPLSMNFANNRQTSATITGILFLIYQLLGGILAPVFIGWLVVRHRKEEQVITAAIAGGIYGFLSVWTAVSIILFLSIFAGKAYTADFFQGLTRRIGDIPSLVLFNSFLAMCGASLVIRKRLLAVFWFITAFATIVLFIIMRRLIQ